MNRYGNIFQNVDMAQVLAMIKEVNSSGMTARDLFYKKAKEAGVDPQTILNKLAGLNK